MANFDDIFNANPKKEAPSKNENNDKKPFDKDAWVKQKQQERDDAFSMLEDMAESVRDSGNMFRSYLDVQARFDRYSVGNALLVAAQMPEATRLADFETWKKSGVYVQKGESGIILLEPGDEYKRDDGSVATSFNPKKVFDISQTNSKQKPGQSYKMDERTVIKALSNDNLSCIEIDDSVPENIGAAYDSASGKIQIRPGMDGDEIIRVLSRELATKAMTEKGGVDNIPFKSFCVSYMISRRTGMDVSKYSFERMPENFKSMDAKAIRAELADIRNTAHDMIESMNRNMEKTKSPRNRDEVR